MFGGKTSQLVITIDEIGLDKQAVIIAVDIDLAKKSIRHISRIDIKDDFITSQKHNSRKIKAHFASLKIFHIQSCALQNLYISHILPRMFS